MTDAKHTPGPWSWSKEYGEGEITGANGKPVCDFGSVGYHIGEDREGRPPNASDRALILSAPDLLAERDRLLATQAELVAALQDCCDALDDDLPIAKRARAALARAEAQR